MAKAVLVMDMPENCFKCNLQDWANCRITKKCHVGEGRPDWCPLRELPEHKRTIGTESEYNKILMNAGWNACLDALAKK